MIYFKILLVGGGYFQFNSGFSFLEELKHFFISLEARVIQYLNGIASRAEINSCSNTQVSQLIVC